ncbi:MAG: sigma-54-dependent Fis family transcriptional regulator [Nitrospirae bacterium]|nr:sigma-54-dependent Fis family transcriptional regulator [Nitrospirota bacterium]
MNKILIVDDEQSVRIILSKVLVDEGFTPLAASSGNQAVEIFRNESPDVVLLDLFMPGMDGMATMEELRKIDTIVPIIIVTGRGEISRAVSAIKAGAYDFIAKPTDTDELVLLLRRAIEKLELEREIGTLHDNVESTYELFLGRSRPIKKIISQILSLAPTNFSLILQGETGTGKSYIANMIHCLSRRSKNKFVTIDIGAIPDSIAESELFGHEKGAFTGAERRKEGLLQIARGGTLFIDEVQNMSPAMQNKLLRAIDERKIVRLGSVEPEAIDIRIIAATNIDIKKAVKEKIFREDLFFRLGEIIIKVPPLRERIEDIPVLAARFCRETCEELDKDVREFSDEAVDYLKRFPWPGNVRQLKNTIRRAVLFCNNKNIEAENIKDLLTDDIAGRDESFQPEFLGLTLKDAEKQAIKRALDLSKGNKKKASELLQIDYSTLLRKIKEINIT